MSQPIIRRVACNQHQHQAVLYKDHETSEAGTHSMVEDYLDVCPPQQGVSNRSKPQSLSVVGMPHIVQHHLSGYTVDGQAQCQPAVDDEREHTDPDGQLQNAQHLLHTLALRMLQCNCCLLFRLLNPTACWHPEGESQRDTLTEAPTEASL